MKNPIFVMSADTRILRDELARVPIGNTIEHAALSKLIGKPIDGGTACLRSAVNSLLRHEGMVFAAIRSVGLKRLNDSEIIQHADQDADKIRRGARRSVMRLTSIKDYDGLTAKEKLAHTSRLSIFTAVASFTTDKSLKKLEAAADGTRRELPLAETLRAFMA